MIYSKKWTGQWIPLICVEAKNWTQRFMTPSLFKTHVLQRFRDKIVPTKLLITKGIDFSVDMLTKIKNYNITQITRNYVDNIKQLIINKLTDNNIPIPQPTTPHINNIPKSVPVHKTRFNSILRNGISNISEYKHNEKGGNNEYGLENPS